MSFMDGLLGIWLIYYLASIDLTGFSSPRVSNPGSVDLIIALSLLISAVNL